MTFDKIQALIVEQLDVDPSLVTMDTDFMKDLEADSLDAVEIILGVEEEYGLEIPDEVAENFTKVSDIVKYIEENKGRYSITGYLRDGLNNFIKSEKE